MYKVLIPQDIAECGKEYLREKGYTVILGSGYDPDTVKREIADCHALIARNTDYPADVIAAGKKLKVIARYGVGTDNIDVRFAEEQGVYVTIAKNANVDSVAEHTIALLFALSKNVVHCDRECRNGNWEIRNTLPGTELKGKTLAIIGLGNIGRATAKIAHFGLGMNILGYGTHADPSSIPEYIKIVSLQEAFEQADAVSLHVPLKPETRNMVNREVLKSMKKKAYLINCARGGVVNEDDLYDALLNKEIAGAATDVFAEEPPKADNKLFLLSNFIASPHHAALTVEGSDSVAMSCAHAIDDVLSGREPRYPINSPKR